MKCKYKIGDVLESRWGYRVTVYKDTDGELVGKLICKKGHSCENIPYALNNGHDHVNITANNEDKGGEE